MMSIPLRQSDDRSDPLDALRGLAIVLMIFSGRIPYGILPDWMYHAQVPPPLHRFDPSIPGITWVDLVFPFFLFSMGAAIPLALTRKLASGLRSVIPAILLRGLVLAYFAIYVQHIKPWEMATDPDGTPLFSSWVVALAGFLLLFPSLARLPREWSGPVRILLRLGGWAGMITLLAFVRYADGSGFSLQRSDIIILVLANVYCTGALIWLFTRGEVLPRLAILAALAAIILSSRSAGWIATVWNTDPFPWVVRWDFQKYLFLVIPGTILGEYLINWMHRADRTSVEKKGYREHLRWILPVIMTVTVVAGLKGRWVFPATLAAVVLSLLYRRIVQEIGDHWTEFLRRFSDWGMALLLLGLACEPFEGGIRKDHATFSYYFVTGGLAVYILTCLIVVMDRLGVRRPFRFLVDTGQNPLVAYAGIHSFVPPLLGIFGLYGWLERVTPGAWPGVLRGAFLTYLTALAGSLCTRRGIRLRT